MVFLFPDIQRYNKAIRLYHPHTYHSKPYLILHRSRTEETACAQGYCQTSNHTDDEQPQRTVSETRLADDRRRVPFSKQTRFGTGRGATSADHRHGKKVRVRHTRHSQAFRVQPAHSQPHQEKRKDRQSHYPDWTQDYRGCRTGAGTGWQENRRTQIKEVIMEYIKEISPEQAVILWQESRLSLSKCYEKAPEILKVHGSVIGTLGNFSASIGKAKSKKTFNVSAIVAAALKNGTVLRYAAELPEEKRKVLYIDTEQSPYHCLKVMKRILRMAGLPDDRDSGYLEFLALRKYTPEQRISIVEQAIYHSPDIGLVIIDGIRDMVYDINSPGESTRIISKLMQWTDDRQIHIHTILHQNKGDENARGHIGTELNNKAETVLLVEKDKGNSDISHVSAMHIRAMDFEPFAFRINDRALPELAEGYKPEVRKPGRPSVEKFDPYKDISEPQHRAALEAAFALKEEYGYKELEDTLIKTYLAEGVRLNHQNAVALITMLRNKRMIVQENGRKYSFKPDYHY